MMKRIQSFLLALVMLLGVVPAAVSAEETGLVLDEGYELVDTAYSAEHGYVVAAKDYTKSTSGNPLPVMLYNSKNGVDWTEVYKDTSSASYNNANKYSGQQLVWWQEAGVFVLSKGTNAVYSSDLQRWTNMPNSVRNNAMIDVEGDTLMSAGGRASRFPTVDNYTGSVQHYCFAPASASANAVACGMTPKDADGNRMYLAITNAKYWLHSSTACTNAEIDTNLVKSQSFPAFATLPVDVKYADSVNGWVTVNKTPRIYTIGTDASNGNFVAIDSETNITAVEVDNNKVIIGTSDGRLYWTDATEGLNNQNTWIEITGSGMNDEVRSISSTQNGSYIAATKSKVFEIKNNSGTLTYDIFRIPQAEELSFGKPTAQGSVNAFEGTWLLGGAYSDKLDMYIAYGNTIAPSEGDYGRIYTSNNGTDWKLALKSQVSFNRNSTNAAVWWDKAIENEDATFTGAFVVSCATNSTGNGNVSKTGWYSADGVHWYYTAAMELCSDGDIVVHGDYLYTLTDKNIINKVSAIQPDGSVQIEKLEFTGAADFGSSAGRKLAVSDDGNTFIMSANYGKTMSWQLKEQKATDMNDGNNNGSMMEIIYDGDLGYFIGTNSFETAVYGMWYENPSNPNDLRRLTFRPFGNPDPDNARLVSIVKHDGRYILGRTNGGVYVTDKNPLSASSVVSTVVPAQGNTKNTIRVRDVVAGAQGKALAIAGGNTAGASDALLIDIENGTYENANSNVAVTANANDVIEISVPYVNTTNSSIDVDMIVAVYKNNTLIQAEKSAAVVSQTENGLLETSITVSENAPDGCSVKVMLWDSEQTPYTSEITPVFG